MNNLLAADQDIKNQRALIVSSSYETVEFVERCLFKLGYNTLVARNGEWALNLLKSVQISYALIDINLPDISCDKLVREIRAYLNDAYDHFQYTPIIVLTDPDQQELLHSCSSAGCDDFLFKPFNTAAINYRISSLSRLASLKQLYDATINEQLLANRILNNALESRNIHIDEIGLFSKPFSIFSGDLFLAERHQDGDLNILIADFTGHGLSAAIGALPVADVFSVMTKKGFGLGHIIDSINNKLHTLLPTGMFMACCVLTISRTLTTVKILNGGMPSVLVREQGTGYIKHNISSSHFPLGICEALEDRSDLDIIEIDITPGDQLILYSDGLTEALNEYGEMFGAKHFELCLQKHRNDEHIFPFIVHSFNEFCGSNLHKDDVTLACIPCTSSIMQTGTPIDHTVNACSGNACHDDWHWYMELAGSNLRKTNPVPLVINEIQKVSGQAACLDGLSNMMSSMYNNVIEYSASEMHQIALGPGATTTNVVNISDVNSVYIRIGLRNIEYDGRPALLVRMEDSGSKFNHSQLTDLQNNFDSDNAGQSDVFAYLDTSGDVGTGIKFEAIIYKNNTQR